MSLFERFIGIIVYGYQLGVLLKPYRPKPHSQEKRLYLQNCLVASKAYFEYLLSIPEPYYASFTCVHWGQVVQAILILSRLTFPLASNMGWDSDTTRTNVPLIMYLDCFCFRLEKLSPPPSREASKIPDALHVFTIILDSVKKSYQRRVANIKPEISEPFGSKTGPLKRHCPMNDPDLSEYLELDDSAYGCSPYVLAGAIGSDASTPATIPPGSLYHDIWATMTSNWVEEM